jgi:hypothetical protein
VTPVAELKAQHEMKLGLQKKEASSSKNIKLD